MARGKKTAKNVTNESALSSPETRNERFMAKAAGLVASAPETPYTREERYWLAIIDAIAEAGFKPTNEQLAAMNSGITAAIVQSLFSPTEAQTAAMNSGITAAIVQSLFSPTEAQTAAMNSGITAAKVSLLDDVTGNGAGAHNAIYRGKSLGNSVTAAQYAAIATGTFDDMYVGDYWTIGNVNWRIAAFDYYLGTGDVSYTTHHHIVIVPDSNLYNAKMNDTNTTAGGYVGSAMHTTNLNTAKSTVNGYFSGHVLTHRLYLCNAVTDGKPSGSEWSDETVVLMNEVNLYGARWYGVANDGVNIPKVSDVDKTQFPLFRYRPDLQTINTKATWLRDTVSAAHFACAYSAGYCLSNGASASNGVRPAFCLY